MKQQSWNFLNKKKYKKTAGKRLILFQSDKVYGHHLSACEVASSATKHFWEVSVIWTKTTFQNKSSLWCFLFKVEQNSLLFLHSCFFPPLAVSSETYKLFLSETQLLCDCSFHVAAC